ncbi:hypothetical protein VPH35_034786 [Triticum aestivum]
MAKASQPPWVVQFNGTSKPVIVAAFDGCSRWDETPDMPALQGKRCLGRDGDWSLMLDEVTNGCSLVNFANTSPSTPTVVALPPLPEDAPDLFLWFGCALSAQTPPDCTVFLDFVRDKSLLYCRPGDPEWSRLPVELAEVNDKFDGPITAGYQGKVYATTMASLDGHGTPPRCPMHAGYKCYPVPCPGGELFLVRCCIFGDPDVVDLKVFLWNQEDNVWGTVESIGDRTFFVGRCTFAVGAVEAGTQPNCIHVLRKVCDEFVIYTVSLDDMTFGLRIVEGCDGDEDDDEDQVFWTLPMSFGLKVVQAINTIDDVSDEVIQTRIEHCLGEQEKEDMMMLNRPLQRRGSVSKISFIDFLHLKAVCKRWNSIESPIQHAKGSPLLMTPCLAGRTKDDLLEVFDPMSEKKYNIRVNIPISGLKSQDSRLLHFTKNGWVIVSKGGDHMYFLVNPFKNYPDGGHVIALPLLDILGLKGLSFSSMPGSPDFVVLAVGATPDYEVVFIQTWRIGDKEWKEEILRNVGVPFFMASHSPVFLDDKVYFLDMNGRLGVVDLNVEKMEWKVPDKPDQPIRGSDYVYTIQELNHSYLAEWKGDLVAIIGENGNFGFIGIFKLDQSRMDWTDLEEMEDAAMFWDRSNALIARPACRRDLCNKVYFLSCTKTDDGVQAYYCSKEQEYYTSFLCQGANECHMVRAKLVGFTLVTEQ